jgi:hypothetical protein
MLSGALRRFRLYQPQVVSLGLRYLLWPVCAILFLNVLCFTDAMITYTCKYVKRFRPIFVIT